MKKNFLKTGVATTLLVAVGCTSVMAAQGTETVQIQYNDIRLVVDGVPITPEDANGSEIEPFIYNGTTYLPIRAVGDAIGKQVTWDGTTKTVYIGEVPGKAQYLIDVCPPYETRGYSEDLPIIISGESHINGFTLSGGWSGAYGSNRSGGYAIFNLGGKYDSLALDIGHVDGSSMKDVTIEIILDGVISQVLEIKAEDLCKHYVISLNGATQMKISQSYTTAEYGFVNIVLS